MSRWGAFVFFAGAFACTSSTPSPSPMYSWDGGRAATTERRALFSLGSVLTARFIGSEIEPLGH